MYTVAAFGCGPNQLPLEHDLTLIQPVGNKLNMVHIIGCWQASLERCNTYAKVYCTSRPKNTQFFYLIGSKKNYISCQEKKHILFGIH